MIRENQLGSLLFVLVLTLGFGPLLWGDWMVNHDNFNGFLPYRHFASAQLRQGLFPFWNPWINLGYPFASDPQSGAWYPVVWILSSLSVYTPRMLAIEWVIHVWIAGLGVVWWFRKGFQLSSDVSWISGLTYAMCGFFTGTAQILPFVIAFILARPLESTARQAFASTGADPWFLFSSPVAIMLMAGCFIVISFSAFRRLKHGAS